MRQLNVCIIQCAFQNCIREIAGTVMLRRVIIRTFKIGSANPLSVSHNLTANNMFTFCAKNHPAHNKISSSEVLYGGIERLAEVEPVETQVTVSDNSTRHADHLAGGCRMTADNGNCIIYFLRFLKDFIALWICGVMYFLKEFVEAHKKPSGIRSRHGEVAIVTGGGRGIGLEVAKQLLAQGMHVILDRFLDDMTKHECPEWGIPLLAAVKLLSSSNTVHGNGLLEELRKEYPQGKVEYIRLDLSSLSSVKSFANAFLERNIPLHILVNNAGIMFGPYKITEDGFESHLEINYLGHFLLTHLLLPRLKQTGIPARCARIINVTSCVHFSGQIKFDDLQSREYYSAHGCYAQSKLAQVMSTFTMQEIFDKEGANVTVNSVHPGIVNTKLYQYSVFDLAPLLTKMLFKTPEQGADTIAHLALSDSIEGVGGKYYENCKETNSSKASYDRNSQRCLWEVTCDLLNIDNFKL